MDTITFADGATFDCSFLSTIPDGTAFVALEGVDFAQAASIFADKNMTREMKWGHFTLVGYTELIMLGVQPYGIQAVLRGGHDEIAEMLEEADNG